MSGKSALGWGGAALAAMVALGLGPHQDWKLRRNGQDTMYLTVRRFTPGHGKWESGANVPFSHLRGLPPETVDGGGTARFEYMEDAGKLVCRGSFSWGRGEGSFDFFPNAQFRSELKKLGFDAPTDELLFSMMLSGVSLDFARVVHDAGLTSSIRQLLDLHTEGVTPEYIRDAQREGYTGFSAQDYVDLRNRGVGPEFLRELKDAGYSLSAREIADLRDQGIDAKFLRQLKDYGLHPPAPDLVHLRMQGVTPRFLDDLKAAGYDALSADEIISLHAQGVSPDFVRTAHGLGYRFSPKELATLRNSGVDSSYLRKLQASGMRTLSAGEIAKLWQNGVD
jgi:hypothetical protein